VLQREGSRRISNSLKKNKEKRGIEKDEFLSSKMPKTDRLYKVPLNSSTNPGVSSC